MGRKPKIIEVEYNGENDEPRGLDIDAIFEDCGGDQGAEIVGRVYRVNSPKDSLGRPTYEAIAKINKVVDEDWLGHNFGSGTYHIKYRVSKDGVKAEKQLNYNVGAEYDKFVKTEESTAAQTPPATCTADGLNLGGLLGSLTVAKVVAIVDAVKAVKEIFAPPPPPPQPQIDFVKLLEVLKSDNKPSVSEAIVIESLKSMKQQQERPQSSIAQQIADYNALKEIFDNNNNEDDAEGGDMSFILDKALQYLPMLLKANNNNYQAVGQQVRENPFVMGIIQNNPDLAQTFFERAAHDYGPENAKALAAGFGYQMDFKAPQAAQQPQESEVVTNENN